MYFVYVLKSQKDRKHYIGSTSNMEKRLFAHNEGLSTSTKHRRPFKVIFVKEFKSKADATKFERLLKKQKGGVVFDRLISLR